MKRWLPQWVSEYRDRHGKPRYRFRRKGYAQYLFKAAPGTESFRQEYHACLEGIAAEPISAGEQRVRPGTFHDLIARYYRSPDFLDPSDRTREVYRGVIERWRTKYGDGLVRDLRTSHLEKMMAEMLPHRTAANMVRKRLSALMNFAIRQGFVATNPSWRHALTRSRAMASTLGPKMRSRCLSNGTTWEPKRASHSI